MIYRLYLSSPGGMSYSGIWTADEAKAKMLCDKFNKQDDNPYCRWVYVYSE